jgi:hypothetical protein
MVPKVNVSEMVEAAKFAKLVFGHIAADISLIASIALGLLALCLFPAATLPASVNAQKWAFAVAALFAVTYLLFRLLAAYYPIHMGKRLLSHLGEDEKDILRKLLKQNKSTDHFDILNAPVASLLSKAILYYPSSLIDALHMNVALEPWALKYLRKHPDVIGLRREEIGSERIHSWDEPTYLPPDET